MSYMIYQRLTSAIIERYRGRPEAAECSAKAAELRTWLASLDIDPGLRDPIVEQAQAIQSAFEDARRLSPTGPG